MDNENRTIYFWKCSVCGKDMGCGNIPQNTLATYRCLACREAFAAALDESPYEGDDIVPPGGGSAPPPKYSHLKDGDTPQGRTFSDGTACRRYEVDMTDWGCEIGKAAAEGIARGVFFSTLALGIGVVLALLLGVL